MKKRNQKKQFPKFYLIYFACLVVSILAITVALGVVSGRLAEYESAQPKYVAAEIFAKYFEPTVDYSALLTDAVYDAGGATSAEITDHLTKVIADGKLTYSRGSSADENSATFIVKAGKVKIASINLVPSDETTEHGYQMYKFDSIELFVSTVSDTTFVGDDSELPVTYTITVHAPEGYSVTVDETALTNSHIIDYFKNKDVIKNLPSDVEGVNYCTYRLSGLSDIPESVTVKDENGVEVECDYDEETLVCTAGISYSDALSEELSEFVTNAITGYAAFMQADSSFSKIKTYFDSDSALYDSIEAAGKDLWMVIDHDSYEFTDVEVGEFFAFNETTVTCHISFNHILYNGGSTARPDEIDMYVFMHKTDAGYKIYEWCNNN